MQMLTELTTPVIQDLAIQHAKKLLDYHLGKYELEEGEIVNEDFDLEIMRKIAIRIIMYDNSTIKPPVVTTYDEIYENI